MLVFVGQAAAKMEIYIRKPASVWSMSLTGDYQCYNDDDDDDGDNDDVDDCGDGKSWKLEACWWSNLLSICYLWMRSIPNFKQ